ncbi:MAG TPA: ATP-binding protein [Chitinophagaceae bacterium]
MDAFEITIYHAVLITSAVLFMVFVYFTITIFSNQRRHYKALQARLKAEINLLEKERIRIAHDLHDELGPLLSVIRIQASEAISDTAMGNVLLHKACVNIDQLAERLGGIARNLTPSQLVKKGLGVALQDFFNQYGGVIAIRMQLKYEVHSLTDAETSLHIYRMMQELVHNSVKHSGASFIDVHIKERKKKMYVLFKDNGKGIGELPVKPGKGLGLESLRSRIELLGGEFRIESKGGTAYFFEIPLRHG